MDRVVESVLRDQGYRERAERNESHSSSDCSSKSICAVETAHIEETSSAKKDEVITTATVESECPNSSSDGERTKQRSVGMRLAGGIIAFLRFVGPGMMIAVAYVDPGNFATDIAAGAAYRFELLFVVLLSNVFAIFLQSLAIKFGTVTGMDLATASRRHLPRWLNYSLYALAEVGIIASDIAEVVGTAIALNLLIPQLPLVAGCLLSISEIMVILLFYRPDGSMRGLRSFEIFVCLMLVGVVVCFCIQLTMVEDTSVGEVFRGFLPSGAIVESQGLYVSCGILGATIMPHGLYLGSGMVQPRVREYDQKKGLLPADYTSTSPSSSSSADTGKPLYVPSHAAIKHSLKYSILELCFSLFIVALFINSAIVVVAGTSLYHNPSAHELDIFGMHDLLSASLSPAAGTIFALALLLSALSAGVVCTLAGQMVCEGALNWTMAPWLRRLITRCISIIPATIIAASVGREGLSAALMASQVVLSTVLPFVTLPLIYFTSRNRYMTVMPGRARLRSIADFESSSGSKDVGIKMANSWFMIAVYGAIWLLIAVMNVANLVLIGIK